MKKKEVKEEVKPVVNNNHYHSGEYDWSGWIWVAAVLSILLFASSVALSSFWVNSANEENSKSAIALSDRISFFESSGYSVSSNGWTYQGSGQNIIERLNTAESKLELLEKYLKVDEVKYTKYVHEYQKRSKEPKKVVDKSNEVWYSVNSRETQKGQ